MPPFTPQGVKYGGIQQDHPLVTAQAGLQAGSVLPVDDHTILVDPGAPGLPKPGN